MYSAALLLNLLFFLLGTAFLTALNGAMRRLHLLDPYFEPSGKYFFYRPFHLFFFPEFEYEGLLCATISAQNITRFFFVLCATMLLMETDQLRIQSTLEGYLPFLNFFQGWLLVLLIGLIAVSFLIGEYIPRVLGASVPETVVKCCAPVASIFMFAAFPITYASIKLSPKHFRSISFEEHLTKAKKELIEIIQRAKVSPELDFHEKKLIEHVLRFKDRIAREVMVPRVDIFSLSASTPIKKAAELVKEEGYSRIPVYRNTVDNIVGVLMYKDVLDKYMEYASKGNDASILDAPIETIQKSVLYTPETKKISNLLLEFRKKQMHFAIVVDEYGGTEGIVTIEDILEEIVGDIEDEYDEEEDMFFPQKDGSWIVDARMGINDVEQQLSLKLPQDGDYDTIGGYIFHCAGTIPSKGFVIHQERFEMEILSSDERKVGKVRLKPIRQLEQKKHAESSENTEERNA